MQFTKVVPILRIFSIEKAKEFYAGFLGMSVDWEPFVARKDQRVFAFEPLGLVNRADGALGRDLACKGTSSGEFHQTLLRVRKVRQPDGITVFAAVVDSDCGCGRCMAWFRRLSMARDCE